MEVCRWLRAPLLALVLVGLGGRMLGLAAAEDLMGPHMAVRLAEMLTPEECELFRALLTAPEPDPEGELTRLSEDLRAPEKGPEGREWVEGGEGSKGRNESQGWPRRWRREVRGLQSLGSNSMCQKELANWLVAKAPALQWDRVARVLRRCGRPDVARELAKSLHQEATLDLWRFAQPYREAGETQAAQAAPAQPLRVRGLPLDWDAQDVLDMWDSWDAWDAPDLILERLVQELYLRDTQELAATLGLAFLGGFVGTLGFGTFLTLLSLFMYISDYGDENQDREYNPESPSLDSSHHLRPGGPDSLWEIKTLP